MAYKSNDFSIENAAKLVGSDAGQQLMALLQQADPTTLQTAMNQAMAGDMQSAKEALSPLLASEQIQRLLRELGG